MNERPAPRPTLAGCKGGDHRSLPDKAGQLKAMTLLVRCRSCGCAHASLSPAISLAPYPCATSCLDAGQRSVSSRWSWLENHISSDSLSKKRTIAHAGAAVACTGARVVTSQPHATRLNVACVLATGRLGALRLENGGSDRILARFDLSFIGMHSFGCRRQSALTRGLSDRTAAVRCVRVPRGA